MISSRVYSCPECGDQIISFQNVCQQGQTADCYQAKRRDSRHSNDENGMICDFLFDISMFCPNIFLENYINQNNKLLRK